MRVVVHWRRRHVTLERLEALRGVLQARPGPDEVVILVTGTEDRFVLPVTVDADAPELRTEISLATDGACAVVVGRRDAFT